MSVNEGATTASSTTVAVTPASGTTADEYTKFVLTVCPSGTTVGCPTHDCAPADVAACAVTGLSAGVEHSVTAVGFQDSKASLASAADTFFARYP